MELLSIIETCRKLGLGRTKLYHLLATGGLRAVKIGRRTFIRLEDASAFVRDLPAYKPVIGGDK